MPPSAPLLAILLLIRDGGPYAGPSKQGEPVPAKRVTRGVQKRRVELAVGEGEFLEYAVTYQGGRSTCGIWSTTGELVLDGFVAAPSFSVEWPAEGQWLQDEMHTLTMTFGGVQSYTFKATAVRRDGTRQVLKDVTRTRESQTDHAIETLRVTSA